MKDLFVTPTFQFLFPIFLLGMLVFVVSTPVDELLSIVEIFLPDQDYITNLNWKVYR